VPHRGQDHAQHHAQHHQVRDHLDGHQHPGGGGNRGDVAEPHRAEDRDGEVQRVGPRQAGTEGTRAVVAQNVVAVGEQQQEQRDDEGERLDSLPGREG
jgi:hypothetical protein